MSTLYLPTGPPGSGKSTLAHRLYHGGLIDRHAIISPDQMREVLTGDRADQSENPRVFTICHAVAVLRLRRGLPVWFDATNLPRPEGLIERALAVGAEVVVIRFDVAPAELRRRNANREHPVPDEVLERFIDLHRAEFGHEAGLRVNG